ncbi:uncharacterized protein LOC143706772 [Siphateles boraxobius]|uniref:uncharacterized protein LOC143706772 n=1 Tax=Siphateles boraxobius TaxID=180520 RepID=UPI0040638CE4
MDSASVANISASTADDFSAAISPDSNGSADSFVEPVSVASGSASSFVEPVSVTNGSASSFVEPVSVANGSADSFVEPVSVANFSASSFVEPVSVADGSTSSFVEPVSVTNGSASSFMEPVSVTNDDSSAATSPKSNNSASAASDSTSAANVFYMPTQRKRRQIHNGNECPHNSQDVYHGEVVRERVREVGQNQERKKPLHYYRLFLFRTLKIIILHMPFLTEAVSVNNCN